MQIAIRGPMQPSSPTGRESSGSPWRWLWREVRLFWPYQATNVCCILVISALFMGVPLLMKWLIDEVLPQKNWRALGVVSVLFFVFYVVRVLLGSVGSTVNALGVQRLMFRLRMRLLTHLQALPVAYHRQHALGDLLQRLERDVTVVGELGSDIMPSII